MLLELVAPTRCAGCVFPGAVLCASCEQESASIAQPDSCPRCGAPYGAVVCTECWDRVFAFEGAVCAGQLEAPLARAVVLHKDARERRLARNLGEMVARSVREAWGPSWPDVVTWIPASPTALRRRGFDHAEAVAREAAHCLGAPVRALLISRGSRDQRALGRSERASNVDSAFAAVGSLESRILVVDDVFTTGATFDSAATALLQGGAQAVRVAAVARAW